PPHHCPPLSFPTRRSSDLPHNLSPHPAEALVLARISPAVRERAAAVRLMVFDVDGVLTDGSLYYGESGELFKRFHAHDGHGLRLDRKSTRLNSSHVKISYA